MRRSMKVGAALIIGGAIIVAAVTLPKRNRGVEVRLESVETRDLVSAVNASGWIRPHRRVDVQSDIMGRVIDLRVVEGQVVKKDEVLLRIDPTQYEAALARAHAAVSEASARGAQARASYIQAERNYARQQRLFERDSTLVSRQALEQAETDFRVQKELLSAADFGIAQARASLGEAQDRLSKTVIRAPMDGTITRLDVEEGETAIVGTMNNPGSLLLTVADLAAMEAVVRVDETDVPEIALGDSAVVTIDAFPRQMFAGRVTEISHSSVRPPESVQAGTGAGGGQAVDFEVVITLDAPPPGLRPDLSATADVITDARQHVTAIPIIALTVRERGDVQALPQEDPAARAAADAARRDRLDVEGVFVVRQGKASFVPIEIGITGHEHFEVLSGVAPGDSVVAGPYEAIRSLRDGDAVRTAPEARNGTGTAQTTRR